MATPLLTMTKCLIPPLCSVLFLQFTDTPVAKSVSMFTFPWLEESYLHYLSSPYSTCNRLVSFGFEPFIILGSEAFMDNRFTSSHCLRQWFTMKPQHAVLVMVDGLYYSRFREICSPGIEADKNCIADEHYLPTFFSMLDPMGISNWSVTYVDWSERRWHPKTYGANEISLEFLKNVSYLAIDSLFPEWKIWIQFLDESTEDLRLDGLEESHPMLSIYVL